jgi:hypothetical protein
MNKQNKCLCKKSREKYDNPVSVQIFDVAGKQIKELQIIKGDNKINVYELNKGLYLIRFDLDNHVYYMV